MLAAPSTTSTPSPKAELSLGRALLAGLTAGAVGALAAVALSLPLKSPDDVFFNSASVALGALVAGAAAGTVRWAVRGCRWPTRTFLAVVAAAFLVVTAGALLFDALPGAPLSGVTRFVVPLAAVVCALIGALTPAFLRPGWRAGWVGPAGAVAAVALGIALAGRGDAESGRLSLPPAPGGATAVAGAAGDAASASGVLRRQDVVGVTFTVLPGESTATYTVREKLAQLPLPNDAVGRTTTISGEIHLDGRPSTITVDLRTLQSDQPRRDNFIRNIGGPVFNRYPFAVFTVTDLPLPEEYREGETVTAQVTGMMKIREVERPLTFEVEARLQSGVLQILGRTDFTWADFEIPPPNIAGIVQVENTVHLEVLIVAKQS